MDPMNRKIGLAIICFLFIQVIGQGAPVDGDRGVEKTFTDKVLACFFKERRNIVFSPLAARVNLSVLLVFSKGKGRKEVEKLLGWSPEDALKGIPALLQRVRAAFDASGEIKRMLRVTRIKKGSRRWKELMKVYKPGYSLRLENKVVLPSMELKDRILGGDFLRMFHDVWKGEITEGGQREGNLFPGPGFRKGNPGTRVVGYEPIRVRVESFLSFRATWMNPFNPRYTKDSFFWVVARDGKVKKKAVKVMQLMSDRAREDPEKWDDSEGLFDSHMPYTEDDLAKALLIPTTIPEFRVEVILPKKREGILQVIEEIERKGLAGFLQRYKFTEQSESQVDLFFPKFSLMWAKRLDPCLKGLGVKEIFNKSNLETLKPMLPSTGGYVEEVGHKAKIAVDEKGICGGALAYYEEGIALYERKSFHVDHSFLMVVRLEGVRVPLMVALIMDPTEGA